MINKKMDKELKIETTKMVEYYADAHHNRYEATDYRILERLRKYISSNTVLLDYGCGKGRVDFFFRKLEQATCIGLDFSEEMIACANENLKSAKLDNITFVCADALEYDLPKETNAFYFFNPFSVQIFQKVLHKIISSYYENPRDILLFFYYPSEEYEIVLGAQDVLEFVEEIPVQDIFGTNNERETVLIFELKKIGI